MKWWEGSSYSDYELSGGVGGRQVSQHGRWMNAPMKTEHGWRIHRDPWNITEPAGE